ncbi:hypothetical protein DES39_0672 [Orbus hercynius]|uniref:Uncharacterized protein n=1 Tax=Orbus hercynius TaxID=593135 RepID=A0A495RJG8_9GAMM|nr:hypothetical protein [Orbus hercynius]RKS87440.1 hypothetical protein DES39_0672 [Orbus hercynius]
MSTYIYISFYSLVVIGFLIRVYFSNSTAMDFYSNKKLNWKRRCAIVFYYVVLFYSAYILVLAKNGDLTYRLFVVPVVPIVVVYLFFLDFIEVPRRFKKRKTMRKR